jgi:uncharacterized membrane protein
MAYASSALKRLSPSTWIALGLVLLYTAVFSLITILNYRTFHYSAFDLGVNAQGMWLLSHGEAYSSIRGMNYLGEHLWLLIVALIPIYRLAPSIETLLVLQSLGLAIGAVPLAILAQRKTGHTWMAAVLAAAWLLSPALQNMNLEHYHPEIFATPLLMWAIERADAGRWRGYWIAIGLAVLAKEDVALTVFGLGLYLCIVKHRRIGLATMVFAIVWFFFSMRVLLPLFNDYGFFRFEGGHWFSGWWANMFNVSYYVEIFGREQVRQYAVGLFAPVAFLSFLAPEVLLGALPSFAVNALSGNPYLTSIDFHYNNQTLPFIYAAAAIGLGRRARSSGRLFAFTFSSQATGTDAPAARHFDMRVPRSIGALAAQVLAGVLLIAAISGNMSLSHVPIQRAALRVTELLQMLRTSPANRDFPEIQAIVDAAPHMNISVSYPLVPQLSYRNNIYVFPNPFIVWNWAVKGENAPSPDIIDMLIIEARLVDGEYITVLNGLVDSGKYRVAKRVGQFLVLEKNTAGLPPSLNVLTAAPPSSGIKVTALHDPARMTYGLGLLFGLEPAMEIATKAVEIPRGAALLKLADGQDLPAADNVNVIFNGAWTAAGRAPLQFRVHVDDGCRIYVDGKVVANRWGVYPYGEVWTSEPVTLTPGKHHIVVEYYEWGGDAGLKVEWATPGRPFRPLRAGDTLP